MVIKKAIIFMALDIMHHTNYSPKVAYFSMEFGLHPRLPIYAGGLGILAGDFLKAAKDLNMPITGLGVLWRNDYTEQYIGDDGYPYDSYPDINFDFLKDTGKNVTINIKGEEVNCKIWLADMFHNAPLYLLDAGYPGSPHGWITSKLYESNNEIRIAQEMILGIGGLRALRALNIDVDVYHFNEGHAVLAGIELIREKMANENLPFREAWNEARKNIVFTTHTPVEAGNEKHDHHTLQYMGANNGLSYEEMRGIGEDPFNMTIAALRLSCKANGVSKLHGQTSREMWCDVCDTQPIISITNGVHVSTWQDAKIRDAFEKGMDLWAPHQEAKKELLQHVKNKKNINLHQDNLLIGFARRAAPYKRSDLIFRSMDVIDPLLREQKLQLIFSGKAHPNDSTGKDLISLLVQMEKRYPQSVVFLENYDMQIAQLMVKGCDIWLNNPIRPLEASGTSGMKAAMNGVLNLSVVDGWIAEGPQHGVSGWLLAQDKINPYQNDIERDENDLVTLHNVLLNEVMPTYYEDRPKWINMMYSSLDMSHWQFSSRRMLLEYYNVMYKKNTCQPISLMNNIFNEKTKGDNFYQHI